jgi:hypothetical protein
LEDRLEEIKGVYQYVRDVKKDNKEAYSKVKSNIQSMYGSRFDSFKNRGGKIEYNE